MNKIKRIANDHYDSYYRELYNKEYEKEDIITMLINMQIIHNQLCHKLHTAKAIGKTLNQDFENEYNFALELFKCP